MAYLAFVFRYKEPKKHVPCTIGEEKSRDGRAKSWTWLPSRTTQSLSDFGWWKTPFQAKLLGKRRTALVPGGKVFHRKSRERVGNRRREFVSLTQLGYDLRWVRDDMVPMTRHIPGSSLSHQQGHRAQKAGEPPQMWRCAPRITLFPSIPQARTLSAHSTSKASVGNISALTFLPHGHGTWDKQKPGSEVKSKTGGTVDYMATNVICLPSLPIKSQHGNNEWSLQISH